MRQQLVGRVIYLGQSYYNNYYLSRALRKRGWRADVVSNSAEGADQFQHGYDIRLDYTDWDFRYLRGRTWLLGKLLRQYASLLERKPDLGVAGPLEGWLVKRLLTRFLKYAGYAKRDTLAGLRAAVHSYDIFHFTNVNSIRFFYYFNPRLFGDTPIGWDVLILKRLGKKIVYSNTGCHDGVTPSSFSTWGDEPVCNICPWRNVPAVCSDERMHAWGRLRNRLADFQITIGGNRKDYNDDPRVHEVPEFYCLDPSVWSPDLLVPTNYRLPLRPETIKVYHAVGNFTTRAAAGTHSGIKSTHIYIPTVQRLKDEGYDVELIFFQDVPNRQLRFYQLQADIIVDMLTVGFFGANVREALMLGKPAVCYLRQEWLDTMRQEIPKFVDELPVVSATPETVYEVLKDLIAEPEKRREIGRRGREFALRWFSDHAGGERLARIYSQLLEQAPPPRTLAPHTRTRA